MNSKIRHPFVAGKFYPGSANEIKDLFRSIKASEISQIDYSLAEREIFGAILPHAGYIYSGYQTIHFFEILLRSKQVFDTFVILHPIHRGVAPDYAVDASERWRTPLGEVFLDRDFINESGIPISTEQQKWEHSAEVILPFIQYYINYPFKIVPVGISHQTPVIAKEISNCLKIAVQNTLRKICLIASSDFTHYAKPEHGREMDQRILDQILERNSDNIFNVIKEHDLTVCGYGPIMTLIDYLNILNKEFNISILKRGHSGEVHPSESVVDYISILFHA